MADQPNSLTQDASTWRANVDASSGVGAVGNVMNPLLFLPLKNSLAMEHGVGSVIFARAAASPFPAHTTYLAIDGTVKYASVNEARFEKNGLLMEGSSENIIIRSEELNTGWGLTDTTISPNVTTAPDGAATADKVVEVATTGSHRFYQTLSPGAGPIAFSIFLKAAERDEVELLIWNATDATVVYAFFNLATGTIGTVGSGTAKMEALADGWYRCSISGTAVSADSNCYAYLTNGGENLSYLGDITKGLYAWGGQCEEFPFASSYIPTTTVAVTRYKDLCEVTSENNIALQADSGTFMADFDIVGHHTTFQDVFNAGNETYRILRGSSTGSAIVGYHGPGPDALFSQIIPNVNQVYRMAVRYDATTGKSSIWVNGVKYAVTSPSDVSDALANTFHIGNTNTNQQLFGHISNFRIYHKALSDQEMANA